MKDVAKRKTEDIVERFSRNIDVYKSGSYNEAQVRREFIEPFFEVLGWDVYNRQGYAEQYKDVVHEDSVKVGVSLKAPDYSFRIGGQRKFFLEAKKPSVSIKDDIDPAYQLRRYAWSAKLPLSVLTDFEELAVYDCRIKPSPRDKVGTGRIAYYTYKRYIDEFDAIYDVFSRDAVLKGSFDRYAVTTAGKRGTAEVDREFLKEIEGWRDSLARNIAVRNSKLTVDELNFAVQQTIDRIIFLRICEDRGIEQYGGLQALLNGLNTYRRLFELFYQADTKYNSGLFDFSADKLTPDIKIDDDVLKGIIDGLYYPKSPYEFSVLGADILGNVYEQFLGKVIRLTAGHNAKVEEKPEVKKAGGVYYTPEYIVEYIVQNTVGRLVEEKTPKKVEALRILDPACGSGSFLIGAYQYLLNYHLKWYIENSPEKYAKGKFPAVYRSGEGWRLTTQEKKGILLNNIFGVDIDRQAVEVTKLSLLLKVLEDENRETIGKNLILFRERVLPNLDSNIKCGNSLIGSDFYSNSLPLLSSNQGREKSPSPLAGEGWGEGDELNRKINPFDWHDPEKGFGKIMKEGGFDAVIGNPPYVRQEMLGEFKPYLQSNYTAYHGMADIYVYFIEQAHRLLRSGGLFGIICSNKFIRTNYGKPVRTFLALKTKILQIVDFGELPVFQNAATFPAIILTKNEPSVKQRFVYAPIKHLSFQLLDEEVKAVGKSLDDRSLAGDNWTLAGQKEVLIIEKMRKSGIPLGEYVKGKVYYGIKTGFNEAFVIDRITRDRIVRADKKSGDIIKPFVVGDDVRKYCINFAGRYLILIPKGWTRKQSDGTKDAWRWFSLNYPALAKHLSTFETIASKRHDKGEYWWELRACDYYAEFEKPKIVYPDIAKESRFTFVVNPLYFVNTVYFITSDDLYLLGILNSKLIFAYFKRTAIVLGDADRGGRLRWIRQDVVKIPIRTIDFNNKKEKEMHDQMASLVDKMLDLNEKLKKAKTTHDRELIERQIKATDNQIDRLVYELYGLTEEEISVVEGK